MKKDVVVKSGFEYDDDYEVKFSDVTPIIEMIKDARAKILEMEIASSDLFSDAETMDKISNIKYQLGHLLTKESK
jgi:hypothetical protein